MFLVDSSPNESNTSDSLDFLVEADNGPSDFVLQEIKTFINKAPEALIPANDKVLLSRPKKSSERENAGMAKKKPRKKILEISPSRI